MLFLPALNDMIGSTTTRQVARQDHPPGSSSSCPAGRALPGRPSPATACPAASAQPAPRGLLRRHHRAHRVRHPRPGISARRPDPHRQRGPGAGGAAGDHEVGEGKVVTPRLIRLASGPPRPYPKGGTGSARCLSPWGIDAVEGAKTSVPRGGQAPDGASPPSALDQHHPLIEP